MRNEIQRLSIIGFDREKKTLGQSMLSHLYGLNGYKTAIAIRLWDYERAASHNLKPTKVLNLVARSLKGVICTLNNNL